MRDIIRQVRRLEISTKKLVEGLIAGNYHSVFKGQGIEFSEIREYVPGDDIRSIDWKVTARFDRPFVKEYIEERDLNVIFFIDISGSGEFGNTVSKRRKTAELVATLMFSAHLNNDNVGIILATDKIEISIPPRKGKRHVFKSLLTLLSYRPRSKATDLKESLSQASKIIKRRSIIFIVSDFYSDDFTLPLKIMRKKHDIIAINIFDDREHIIPDIGLIELEDQETGEQLLLDTSDKGFQERFGDLMASQKKAIASLFSRLKIDCISISTDQPYAVALKRFFAIRKRRVI